MHLDNFQILQCDHNMKHTYGRFKIDVLRNRLKNSASTHHHSSSNFPPSLSKTPNKTNLKKSISGFSRDISHMQDPKSAIKDHSSERFLLRTITPHLYQKKPKVLESDIKPQKRISPFKDSFLEALHQFTQKQDEHFQQGLLAYKENTQKALTLIEQIFNQKLVEITPQTGFIDYKSNPSGRREVELLENWLSNMLQIYVESADQPFDLKINAYRLILKLCLKELIQQVGVQCHERGDLLQRVINAINSSYIMTDKGMGEKIRQLQQKIKDLTKDHQEQLQLQVNRVRAQNLKLSLKFNRKNRELMDQAKEREQLYKDVQTFKKRVYFLQNELENRNAQNPAPAVVKINKQSQLVFKKHVSTNTYDREFTEHTLYQRVWYPPKDTAVLLVGTFESHFFKKVAAYVPHKGKVVPSDFPADWITFPKCRHVSVATEESPYGMVLNPNVCREVEIESLVKSEPSTLFAGLYQDTDNQCAEQCTKGVQAPLTLPNWTTWTEEIAVLISKMRIRRIRKKKTERDDSQSSMFDDQSDKLFPRRTFRSKRGGGSISRTSSMQSACSNKSSSKSAAPEITQPQNTQVCSLSEQVHKLSQNLSVFLMNSGQSDDINSDEYCKAQAEKVKKLLDTLFPTPQDHFLNAIRESRRDSLINISEEQPLLDTVDIEGEMIQIHVTDSPEYNAGPLYQQKSVQVNFTIPMVSFETNTRKKTVQRTSTFNQQMAEQFKSAVGDQKIMVKLPSNPYLVRKTTDGHSHPAQDFIRNFLVFLSNNSTMHQIITQKQLLKIISKVYFDRYTMTRENHRAMATPASVILYELMMKQYGLKTVAEQKLRQVILGCYNLAEKHPRIRNFSSFLGLREDYSIFDWNCYMQMLEYAVFSNPQVNKDVAGNLIIHFDKIVEFVDSFFRDKVDADVAADLVQKLNLIKMEDESKRMGRGSFLSRIDADEAFLALLDVLALVKKRAIQRLSAISEYVLQDARGFSYDEFAEMIFQLKIVPEEALRQWFTVFKENQVIPLDAVIWFVVENSLI